MTYYSPRPPVYTRRKLRANVGMTPDRIEARTKKAVEELTWAYDHGATLSHAATDYHIRRMASDIMWLLVMANRNEGAA